MIFEKKIVGMYQKTLLQRHDYNGILFYFSKDDFPGLECEEYSFEGDKGQKLSAYLYYKGEKSTDRVIMFEHGMGNGHVAYMQEINLLCDAGYTIFTYDHTGTRCSEGEHIGGFAQSLADLDKAVRFVKTVPGYSESSISVIGHSWGGFSTMNIPALYPKITHVVALSGFISPKAIQEQVLTGFLKLYRKAIYKAELEAFPDYAKYDGRVSLANVKTKALIIHSRDDKTCLFDNHFEEMRRALAGHQNVEFLPLDGKGHNPNYTAEAVKLKDEMSAAMKDKTKSGKLGTDEEKAAFQSSWDWKKITEQDMDVWNTILKFLKK
jgi:dipeptidyl aminopeptidase/acylaminoacyl peptidase